MPDSPLETQESARETIAAADRAAAHVLTDAGLRRWHFDGHGSYSDSIARTHCICFGAAYRTADALFVALEAAEERATRAEAERDKLRFVVAALWRDLGRTEGDAAHPSWSNAATSAILGALRAEPWALVPPGPPTDENQKEKHGADRPED